MQKRVCRIDRKTNEKIMNNGAKMGSKIDKNSIKKRDRRIDAKNNAKLMLQGGTRGAGGNLTSTRLTTK